MNRANLEIKLKNQSIYLCRKQSKMRTAAGKSTVKICFGSQDLEWRSVCVPALVFLRSGHGLMKKFPGDSQEVVIPEEKEEEKSDETAADTGNDSTVQTLGIDSYRELQKAMNSVASEAAKIGS